MDFPCAGNVCFKGAFFEHSLYMFVRKENIMLLFHHGV